MASDTPDWFAAAPSVTAHPAAQGGTPTDPATPYAFPDGNGGIMPGGAITRDTPTFQRWQQEDAAAKPPAASADTPDWFAAAPSITAHPAAQMAQPEASPAMHPTSGPTDSLATDIPRRLGTAATDALGGFLGMPSAVAHGVDWLGNKVGLNIGAQPALSSIQQPGGGQLFPDPATAKEMAYHTTGATEYLPSSTIGRIGQGALTGALTAPVTGLTSIAEGLPQIARSTLSALPASAAAGGGAAAAGELAPNNVPLQIGGAILGAKLGQIGANAGTAVTGLRQVAGGPLDAGTAALAQRANDLGIPLAPGQLSNGWVTRNLYDLGGKIPFSGADEFSAAQRAAWIRAVSRVAGENADHITPEVLSNMRDRLGTVFNGVAGRTSIPMSNNFLSDLQDVVTRARLNTSAANVEPIERQALNIINTAANNGGDIGGRAYLDLTAKGGDLDTMMQSTDPAIRQAGIRLRQVIDNHLAQNAATGDVAALEQARAQWKAMKTIEPLTLRADTVGGATPSTGDIDPSALLSAVKRSYKNAATASIGEIPLSDLAKIGQRFLASPKSSATAERSALEHGLEAVKGIGAGLIGAGAEHAAAGGDVMGMAAGAAGSLAANRALQALLRNQMIARAQIAGSLNPNGFRFAGPRALPGALLALLPSAAP